MDITKLKELRKAIDEAPRLPQGQYVNIWEDSDCFCAVGHMFRIGGMSVEDMSVLEERATACGSNAIRDLITGSTDDDLGHSDNKLQILVEKALEPFGGVDELEFLQAIQRINDTNILSDTERKVRLLLEIDNKIEELQTV